MDALAQEANTSRSSSFTETEVELTPTDRDTIIDSANSSDANDLDDGGASGAIMMGVGDGDGAAEAAADAAMEMGVDDGDGDGIADAAEDGSTPTSSISDSLLRLACAVAAAPGADAEEAAPGACAESSFDSQATLNDDPMDADGGHHCQPPVGLAMSVGSHPYFRTIDERSTWLHDLESKLAPSDDLPWFHSEFMWDTISLGSYSAKLEAVYEHITYLTQGCAMFKIGITEQDPSSRMAMGYVQEGYDAMHFLYVYLTGKPSDASSTGRMERALITRCKPWPACQNIAPGGERATAGNPNFLYVVIGAV
jgi:hypothetical protein